MSYDQTTILCSSYVYWDPMKSNCMVKSKPYDCLFIHATTYIYLYPLPNFPIISLYISFHIAASLPSLIHLRVHLRVVFLLRGMLSGSKSFSFIIWSNDFGPGFIPLNLEKQAQNQHIVHNEHHNHHPRLFMMKRYSTQLISSQLITSN